MTLVKCDGCSDDCTGIAETRRDTSGFWSCSQYFCAACAAAYDRWLANYDGPGDPDGEDIFRDYAAEQRDQAEAARRLK